MLIFIRSKDWGDKVKRTASILAAAILFCVSAHGQIAVTKSSCVLLYTDPGSGVLLLQILTASGLMISFYFSRARKSIAKWLGLGKIGGDTQNSAEETDQFGDHRS